MSYKHLSSDDRIVIDTLLCESRDNVYIADRIGVDKSTIGREIKRNASKRRLKHPKPVIRPAILDFDGRRLRSSGLTKDKYEAIASYNKESRIKLNRAGSTTTESPTKRLKLGMEMPINNGLD